MKANARRLSLLLLLLLGAGFADRGREARASELVVSPSPFRLIAAGVHFDGSDADPGTFDLALTHKGKLYGDSNVPADGFVVKDLRTEAVAVYQPLELAKSAGWLEKGKEYEAGNNIWGIRRSRDTIWMGTHGFGVFAFDTNTRRWTRYDTETAPAPGERLTWVFHADAEYVFASNFHVFSNRHRRWMKIAAVPMSHVSQLGTNTGSLAVAIEFDLRVYKDEPSLPLSVAYALERPDHVSLTEDGSAYVFEYVHDSQHKNGAPKTVFKIERAQLARAFGRLRGSPAARRDPNGLRAGSRR
jgi:hypothetical protein